MKPKQKLRRFALFVVLPFLAALVHFSFSSSRHPPARSPRWLWFALRDSPEQMAARRAMLGSCKGRVSAVVLLLAGFGLDVLILLHPEPRYLF